MPSGAVERHNAGPEPRVMFSARRNTVRQRRTIPRVMVINGGYSYYKKGKKLCISGCQNNRGINP
jgi:hypothetical protein